MSTVSIIIPRKECNGCKYAWFYSFGSWESKHPFDCHFGNRTRTIKIASEDYSNKKKQTPESRMVDTSNCPACPLLKELK